MGIESMGGKNNSNEAKQLPNELNQKFYVLVKERFVTQRAEDTTGRKQPRTAEMVDADIQSMIKNNPQYRDALEEEAIRLDELFLSK